MNDPTDDELMDQISKELSTATYLSPFIRTDTQSLLTPHVVKIINYIFYSVICITMFLCFFSLCASMSANLYEQKKEVGILRAMGFTKKRLKLLYFYEAIILVVSSCFLGVLIGVMVGYTMSLQ